MNFILFQASRTGLHPLTSCVDARLRGTAVA